MKDAPIFLLAGDPPTCLARKNSKPGQDFQLLTGFPDLGPGRKVTEEADDRACEISI